MAIQFPCSQCGRTLKVDDRTAGAKIRCPQCQAVTRAPAAEPAATEPKAEPAPRSTPTPRPEKPAQIDPAKSGMMTMLSDDTEPVAFSKREPSEEDDIDMTSMVDVTFLLLVFFMITAAFNLQKSLEIPKPSEDNAVVQNPINNPEEGNIIVRIDRENVIFVNDVEAPSEQDLLIKLREAKEGVPGTDSMPINSVLVMADSESLHETVVMALDACNEVDIEKIKLATVDEDDL